jgi:beta-galactosidase
MMNVIKWIVITILINLLVIMRVQAQQVKHLENWNFIKSDVNVTSIVDDWERVKVPHSWNAKDGQDGGDYYRGIGWYQTNLDIENQKKENRYFLKFQAVGTSADVFLNQQKITSHAGGYTAFATEITDLVSTGGVYDLRVKANNAYNEAIAPLSGDFTIAGGMHKPVELLIKNSVCISPLDYASPGVYLYQENVSDDSADLRVRVLIDNGTKQNKKINTVFTLTDDKGNEVVTSKRKTKVGGKTVENIETVLSIKQPHLWDGIKDPYLYTLKVELYCGKNKVDAYTKKVGFRYFHVDPKIGFYLNGRSYPLRGVNMHHDRKDFGAALSQEQLREDYERVMEIGANSVRLAHYPHSDFSYKRCDELGLLVWAEIPIVNEIKKTDSFSKVARQQLLDLIKQQGNNTSIYCWSISNEIFQKNTDSPFELLNELNALSKKIDPTRFTALASNHNREDLTTITDLFAVNLYPGWYGSNPFDMKGALPGFNKEGGNRGLGVSEYGAGGSILHQDQTLKVVPPGGKWHPEQWQAYLHEVQYRDIVENASCWGSYVWPMFDFSSDHRDEGGQPGVNDKGLMTHDHKTRKDAFFFYQANWSELPVVHLTSKRHLVRNNPKTIVKVYSNTDAVELFVNGESFGFKTPNDFKIAQWDSILLSEGENHIVVKSFVNATELIDEITWTYNPNAQSPIQINTDTSEVVEGLCRASNAEAGNGPAKAFDDNIETRWATPVKGAWIGKELDESQVISSFSIRWFKGKERGYHFKIETSSDGNTWRKVYEGISKKMTTAETYKLNEPDEARHIRIICSGSDINDWSSILNVKLN